MSAPLYAVRYLYDRYRVIPISDWWQAQAMWQRKEPGLYVEKRVAWAVARRMNKREDLGMEGDSDAEDAS